MILYFTGTGNSRFLAEIIAKQLNDELVDVTAHIHKKAYPTFQSQKPYVFVAPTYAWRMPHILEEWIRKCKFSGNQKTYFVLNCGSEIGAAGNYAKKLCKQMKFEYMGTAEVVMPENYIVMFSAPSEEESDTMIHKAQQQVPELVTYIEKEMPFPPVKITLIGRLCSGIVNVLFYKFTVKAKKFRVKDTCISCGLCAKKCMLSNITLENGKPVWGKDCTHCMACICSCPKDAIEYGKHTVGLRRYTFDRQMQRKPMED